MELETAKEILAAKSPRSACRHRGDDSEEAGREKLASARG
jgi:hypothetical protein